jgi:hypothetical protein
MMLMLACVVIGGVLASCGSFTPAEPRVREDKVDLTRFPPDFAVSVMVLLPGNRRDAGMPAWLTPAWYVVEADGNLRASEGVRAPGAMIPPLVGSLRHEEIAELWSTIRAGGLGAGRDADLTSSVSLVEGVLEVPPTGVLRPTAAVYVSSSGRRRGYLVDLSARDSTAGRTRDLTARLAQLAGVGRGEE